RPFPDLHFGEAAIGERALDVILARGLRAGTMFAEIVRVRAIDDGAESARLRHRHELGPQLALAEVASVGWIRGIARIAHFIGVELDDLDLERPCDVSRSAPLLRWIRRAAADDRQHMLGTEGAARYNGKVCGIHAA